MLMADAQQAQKESGPYAEYTMDSFPRYREADHVLKYTVRVVLRGISRPFTVDKVTKHDSQQLEHSAALREGGGDFL